MYYTYMIRCEDNSIYTGITTDLNRRMEEHFTKTEKCAKYTFRHDAKKLERAWEWYISLIRKRKKTCWKV